jgi:hypothetical protein
MYEMRVRSSGTATPELPVCAVSVLLRVFVLSRLDIRRAEVRYRE